MFNTKIRNVPKTGVIYVAERAEKKGFFYGNKEWSNLGQGSPETGLLKDGPLRINEIKIDQKTAQYSPISGNKDLRTAIAKLYNERYRKDKKSKYTYENVSISPGGRSALCRIVSVLNNINIGHLIPDYTAYEELLNVFSNFVPIPISLAEKTGFKPNVLEIKKAITNMGLGGLLLSNPCNPTGQIIAEKNLKNLVNYSLSANCSIIFDEFYSHYMYKKQTPLSASKYINNINQEDILIVDGLTKNWRYPGLRIAWTLGPKSIIDVITSAGSFLDGGASNAIQKNIIPLLNYQHSKSEFLAIRKEFTRKREYMIQRIRAMNLKLTNIPQGGFYCFVSLEKLPKPLDDGMTFFEHLLEYKVICVPGEFFDVNPGQRRTTSNTRLKKYIRLSFGPCFEEIKQGLDRIERMIN